MVDKESPADKAKRLAAEKAENAKLKATEDKGTGDDAGKLSDIDSKAAELTDEDVTTDTGDAVEATGPVMTEVPDDKNDDPLTEEEVKALVGDLEPGEMGWLPLDRLGRITGPAKKGRPGPDEMGAAVQAVVPRTPLSLQTPSGAPILRRMNPGFTNTVKPRYG